MKTLWRTRHDYPLDNQAPADSQTLTDADVTRTEAPAATSSRWTAQSLRPVAHWVLMPTAGGDYRLQMIWEVPGPMPSASRPSAIAV